MNDRRLDTCACCGANLTNAHAKIEQAIQDQGWFITSVMATEEASAFAYTTGLTERFEHPELLMIGWDHDTMVRILHAAAQLVRTGSSFEETMYSHELVPQTRTIFLPLPQDDATELLRVAAERYGENGFRTLLVVPDRSGRVSPPGDQAISTARPLVWTRRWITTSDDHVIAIEQNEWSPEEFLWAVATDWGETFAAGTATSLQGAQALAVAEMVALEARLGNGGK